MAPFGFVGIGIMGEGMATCLLNDGRSLVVWNRDASKSEKLKLAFPRLVTVAATAATEGKSIVDCALTPERMRDMRGAVTLAGGRFLEAPVSGSKAPAAQGALIFLCGGDETLYAEVKPELAVMGKADFLFGDVGAGTKMKLVVNMVMGDMMVALSEGLSLCGAAGLPGDAEAGLLKVLDLGIMSNGMFRLKGPKMLAGDHAPNFPLKHAQKDMRFALNLGDQVGQALPVSAAANAAFLAARAQSGDDDFSAVYEQQKAAK
ncbi:3-hydroxyisobutyrate dehydrogenase [Aureococcus anophagefferens]|nr:3-hydroxyisobutyrate dehydrogenase [Aureococcus anophagefferens]